jgi:hypothetical protein
MKTLARRTSGDENAAATIEGFQRALDQSYARFRELARAEWQRQNAGPDPSDACVHVHIGRSCQTYAGDLNARRRAAR